jgi:hypothetical protein
MVATKNFPEKFLTSRERRPGEVAARDGGHKKLPGEVFDVA